MNTPLLTCFVFVFRGRGEINVYKFTNEINYSRDRKKLKQAKVIGSGADGVSKVKDEAGDMFPYLAWLDSFL